MIIVDANLLLYAYNTSAEEHSAARNWIEEALSGDEPVGLTWHTILAFMRIATNPRAFPHPLSRSEAIVIVSQWLERPQTVIVAPGEHHWETFQRVCSEGKAAGPLLSDVHLAALAIENGATLCSTDRDFARFPKLKLRNPIQL